MKRIIRALKARIKFYIFFVFADRKMLYLKLEVLVEHLGSLMEPLIITNKLQLQQPVSINCVCVWTWTCRKTCIWVFHSLNWTGILSPHCSSHTGGSHLSVPAFIPLSWVMSYAARITQIYASEDKLYQRCFEEHWRAEWVALSKNTDLMK